MVKWLQRSDYEYVSKLSDQIYQKTANKSFFSWGYKDLLSELKSGSNGLVYQLKKAVVAFIVFRDSEDFIDIMTLGVDPMYQGHGYMSETLDSLLTYSTANKKRILLEVHEENRKAIQIYINKGFKVLHKRLNYYPDGQAALVMEYVGNKI